MDCLWPAWGPHVGGIRISRRRGGGWNRARGGCPRIRGAPPL